MCFDFIDHKAAWLRNLELLAREVMPELRRTVHADAA
jgi:hypothetical protein